MGAMDRVAGLEADHRPPAPFRLCAPDLERRQVVLGEAGLRSPQTPDLARDRPAAALAEHPDPRVGKVVGAVDGGRLERREGAVLVLHLHHRNWLAALPERDPVGCQEPAPILLGRPQHDRDGERLATCQPAGLEHGRIVPLAQEPLERREGAGRQHQCVGHLPWTDVQPWQRTHRRALALRQQPLADATPDVPAPLQLVEDPLQRLPHRLAFAVDDHLRRRRRLVRVADAGEVRQLAGDGLGVEALDVAARQLLE